jgi:hypothetical protein
LNYRERQRGAFQFVWQIRQLWDVGSSKRDGDAQWEEEILI